MLAGLLRDEDASRRCVALTSRVAMGVCLVTELFVEGMRASHTICRAAELAGCVSVQQADERVWSGAKVEGGGYPCVFTGIPGLAASSSGHRCCSSG